MRLVAMETDRANQKLLSGGGSSIYIIEWLNVKGLSVARDKELWSFFFDLILTGFVCVQWTFKLRISL